MAVTGSGYPVPVFTAIAPGAWRSVQELRARSELRLVTSPRHASVLLVAGAVPNAHLGPLDVVHDQLPHPRATVHWTAGDADGVVADVVRAHRRLVEDPSCSEPDRRPDQEPNEWRGVGPFGQGGEGMMGGTPYGRPMAMTGDDRDGLALDRLHLRLGPFLDALPAGLVLDVTLQGEVLQEVAVDHLPSSEPALDDDHGPAAASWFERHRSLTWLAHALHVQGLEAYASRAAGLAVAARTGRDIAADAAALRRHLRRSGLFWTLRGIGPIDGLGDVSDRWRWRLDRIERPTPSPGPPEQPVVAADGLAGLLPGMTLTDAITTIVSLDLDPVPTPSATR